MKKHLLNLFIMFTLCTVFVSCTKEKNEWSVTSPSENIEFQILQAENGQLMYNVSLVESGVKKQIIANSPLGIRRADASFIQNMKFERISDATFSESFSLPTGKRKYIDSEVNEITLTFKNDTGSEVELIVRVSNNGAAFRYRFPEADSKMNSVEEEITGFTIAGEGKAWMAPYDKVTMYSPCYERYLENCIPIGTTTPREEF